MRSFFLPMNQMISIIKKGLTKSKTTKKIVIVGAGMAGLVSGFLLKQAGHEVKIIEARSRTGGRVLTIRNPFQTGNYLEAGAMRIPTTHQLTMEYIRKFHLKTQPFINRSPNDLLYINGVKTQAKIYEKKPTILKLPMTKSEQAKTADQLITQAIQRILDFIQQNPQKNWPKIIRRFGRYSVDSFFRHNPVGPSLSPGAMEAIKLTTGLEGFPELSFLEVLREYLIILSPQASFVQIKGGTDCLPKALEKQLKKELIFHQQLQKIQQYKQGFLLQTFDRLQKKTRQWIADYVILTIPYPVLQFVEMEPRHLFSHHKWKAIRELHYLTATKIGLEFNQRFWQKEGLYGGQVITDLPIRIGYLPSHEFQKNSGVMIASYTWEDDALAWDCLSSNQAIQQAFENVSAIFGSKIRKHFQNGFIKSWGRDPYSGGGFSFFKPEQEQELFFSIIKNEGNIFFAGEHASEYRGWMQGAIQSAIQAAYKINQLANSFNS